MQTKLILWINGAVFAEFYIPKKVDVARVTFKEVVRDAD